MALKDCTLDDLAVFQNGKSLSPSMYISSGKYPVWGANGQIARTDKPLFAQPVIVVGRVGANCGSVYFIKEPSWISDNAIVATPKKNVDCRFLYYLMKSLNLDRTSIGSAQPLITQGGLKVVNTSAPDIPTQKAIAHILGTLDDKIELTRRMNKTLEEMARAIFKSWFVDFDPVIDNALAAGNPIPDKFRKRAEERKKKQQRKPLPASIQKLFPDSFQDSELGPIPKGWKVIRLNNIASLQQKSVKPMNEPNKLWEHYSIPAFDSGRIPLIEKGSEIKSNKYMVPISSVLMSKLNPKTPRVWMPNVMKPESAICSTEFLPFVPKYENWRPFLYELFNSDAVQQGILAIVTGSTGSRQRVKPKDVKLMEVVNPYKNMIELFSYLLNPIYDKILFNIQASQKFATIRDTLLPKLISGEIRVKEAEHIVERSVCW